MRGGYGQPCDWRKPNSLLTLQFGDTAKEQLVFAAYGAPHGECDSMTSALKRVPNLIKVTSLEWWREATLKAVRTDLRKPWRRSCRWTLQERWLPWEGRAENWRDLCSQPEVKRVTPSIEDPLCVNLSGQFGGCIVRFVASFCTVFFEAIASANVSDGFFERHRRRCLGRQ